MEKFPCVGTSAYEKLEYHDKLFVLSLYLFDRDKYKLLVEYGKSSTDFYIDQKIAHLTRANKLGTPSDDVECCLSIECGYWGAYLCYYDPISFQRNGTDPLGDFGIEHERALGMNLFSFPVLRTDFLGKEILSWIFNAESSSVVTDPVFSLATMRVACDACIPNASERVLIAKRAKSKGMLRQKRNDPALIKQNMTPVTLDEVDAVTREFFQTMHTNEGFDFTLGSVFDMAGSFMRPSVLFDDIDSEQLVLLSNKCRKFGKWWYAPIVPAAMFNSKFTIRDWSFLHPASNGKR